jgi:hypothetical protein
VDVNVEIDGLVLDGTADAQATDALAARLEQLDASVEGLSATVSRAIVEALRIR